MGYRSILERFDVFPLPEGEPQRSTFERSYARAIHLRTRFLDGLRDFMKAVEGAPPPDLAHLPDEARALASSWRQVDLVNTPGPDHIALACSLAPTRQHFPLRGLYTLVFAAGASSILQLAMGDDDPQGSLPVRGGIDIAAGGLGAKDRFLYSPALMRAYDLESKRAVFPRVIAGERFHGFLTSQSNDDDDTPAGKYARALARRIAAMFFRDADGEIVLDIFGDAIRSQVDSSLASDLASKAWRFTLRMQSEVQARDNKTLIPKYEWLANYMRPRLSAWGVAT